MSENIISKIRKGTYKPERFISSGNSHIAASNKAMLAFEKDVLEHVGLQNHPKKNEIFKFIRVEMDLNLEDMLHAMISIAPLFK